MFEADFSSAWGLFHVEHFVPSICPVYLELTGNQCEALEGQSFALINGLQGNPAVWSTGDQGFKLLWVWWTCCPGYAAVAKRSSFRSASTGDSDAFMHTCAHVFFLFVSATVVKECSIEVVTACHQQSYWAFSQPSPEIEKQHNGWRTPEAPGCLQQM